MSDAIEVTISVIDELDQIVENAKTGHHVYYSKLKLSDGQFKVGTIQFRLTGPDASLFTIDDYGLVRIQEKPNFEAQDQYVFNINLIDKITSEVIGSEPVNISVINENDNIPKFSVNNFNYDLPTALAIGTQIAAVSAFDNDGDDIAYSVKSGNKNDILQINSTTGVLTTAKLFTSIVKTEFFNFENNAIDNTTFHLV